MLSQGNSSQNYILTVQYSYLTAFAVKVKLQKLGNNELIT